MAPAAGALAILPLAAALSAVAPAASSARPSAAFSAFSWHEQWYPIAFSAVTARGLPQRVELFGEPIALWHTGERWAAMADACPRLFGMGGVSRGGGGRGGRTRAQAAR